MLEKPETSGPDTVLGIDLGANSIGWAFLDLPKNSPGRIIAAGVRVFEAGVNENETGEKASKSFDRRGARGRRRLLERNARRRRKLLRAMQRANLLPLGDLHGHLQRHPDEELAGLFLDADPYVLRAEGLQRRLEIAEFARAIYHLARRRGFETNRKAPRKSDEKPGELEKEFADTEAAWKATGAPTFGAYLAMLDPHEQRRRTHHSRRQWFRDEFDVLWNAQRPYHPDILTDTLHKNLHRIIFHQRPLKAQTHLIGVCDLEKRTQPATRKLKDGTVRRFIVEAGPKRAPMAALPAQRARMLQTVNDMRIIQDGRERNLTPDERAKTLDALDRVREMKLATLRGKEHLNLPRGAKFNFEAGERVYIPGNDTAAQLRKAFGDRWDTMSTEPDRDGNTEQDRIVFDLLSIQKDDLYATRARKYALQYDLSPAQEKALAGFKPEEGYHRLSLRALRRIVPHLVKNSLENGAPCSMTDAIALAYPDRAASDILDQLPSVGTLRNPIVQRSLAELRKVVNAVIRRHGKPATIRIELARELKKTQKQRDEISVRNARNRRARDKAREAVIKESGHYNPSPRDIEKYLLWEECGGFCPYTGKSISLSGETGLFGTQPAFDVEHIIPFSRSFDNSFLNKTLCCVDFNRNVKRNQTPWEAVGRTAEAGDEAMKKRWQDTLEWVGKFNSDKDAKAAKLERFRFKSAPDEESFLDGFSSRQLNDTRYASRQAREYLGLLYGSEAIQRVQPLTGQITAYLRSAWKMNPILNGDAVKSRDDHRHHAIDALCIALTSAPVIHRLHSAAGRGVSVYRPGTFPDMPLPWPDFVADARNAVESIMVSHRVSRKVNGPLHRETFYGEIPDPLRPGEKRIVVRKRLESLGEKDFPSIVDRNVREAAQAKLAALAKANGIAPAKAVALFKEPSNLPFLRSQDGRNIPIRKVRIYVEDKPTHLGGGDHLRRVTLNNNHHLAIYEARDKKGQVAWRDEVISLLEAKKRVRNGQSPVAPHDAEGHPLVFSLVIGDAVEMEMDGVGEVWVVRSLSDSYYMFKRPQDAMIEKDFLARKGLYIANLGSWQDAKTKSPNSPVRLRYQSIKRLQETQCRRVTITPLGEALSAK